MLGWDSRHEIPDDEMGVLIFTSLIKTVSDRLGSILEEEIIDESDHESPDFIIKTFYRQCLDEKKMDEEGDAIVSVC